MICMRCELDAMRGNFFGLLSFRDGCTTFSVSDVFPVLFLFPVSFFSALFSRAINGPRSPKGSTIIESNIKRSSV